MLPLSSTPECRDAKPNPRAGLAGFTLIEMLVVIALISVLAAIAVPSMRDFIANSRMQGPVQQMLRELAYARSEAVKRAKNVALCPTANANAALDAVTCSSSGTDWQSGWIVFVDENGNGDFNAGDELLKRSQQPSSSAIDIRGNGGSAPEIAYDPRGSLSGTGRTVRFCVENQRVENRRIVVSGFGRARIELGNAKSSDSDGGGITC